MVFTILEFVRKIKIQGRFRILRIDSQSLDPNFFQKNEFFELNLHYFRSF
ncbi:hypothetical protein LEP1GSC049_3633 [Leptospira kirschneri serovar Cynopteri str. 3522 CT]|nr:hypothetical protein LEP1GSC065_2088 [Leptospira kirschneri serovar Sokoine str. RM1]EPG50699.1 hypothetical protein LEP1GSC049_3633 [Leptospira kirschneri serovar Cynopteri str. 3522 CT]